MHCQPVRIARRVCLGGTRAALAPAPVPRVHPGSTWARPVAVAAPCVPLVSTPLATARRAALPAPQDSTDRTLVPPLQVAARHASVDDAGCACAWALLVCVCLFVCLSVCVCVCVWLCLWWLCGCVVVWLFVWLVVRVVVQTTNGDFPLSHCVQQRSRRSSVAHAVMT